MRLFGLGFGGGARLFGGDADLGGGLGFGGRFRRGFVGRVTVGCKLLVVWRLLERLPGHGKFLRRGLRRRFGFGSRFAGLIEFRGRLLRRCG